MYTRTHLGGGQPLLRLLHGEAGLGSLGAQPLHLRPQPGHFRLKELVDVVLWKLFKRCSLCVGSSVYVHVRVGRWDTVWACSNFPGIFISLAPSLTRAHACTHALARMSARMYTHARACCSDVELPAWSSRACSSALSCSSLDTCDEGWGCVRVRVWEDG
jgi:hypothetical protein